MVYPVVFLDKRARGLFWPLCPSGKQLRRPVDCFGSSFLRHLLSPTTVLEDQDQMHPMLFATRLFLTTLDVDTTDLPDAGDFGPVPALPFLHAAWPGGAAPLSLDDAFWKKVAQSPPPVPQASQPGQEAEAPWVRLNRRANPRRGGHGKLLD